ncbi:hypothetical protein H6789_02535 [Candidatus Nomurabacteria bacterium]|nr:hypothetical protein [Candidatus Kaiserbacteria bacterium]MCB9815333.1 hypothetical protein [Candidatus Nomurabacteria bacterium]MCB9819556.1 hypothetical protein [Candidatus Nomurabacteria bacterium]
MENLKDIVVIYHAQCRDGFGSAYAAWKKFGDNASYLPRKNQAELPAGLENKEIYILDYSFCKEILEQLISKNKSVLVIDHHKSSEESVTSFPDNIFDLEHSGAVLSWKYFHPESPVPPLLEYIEDHDLWNMKLPHNREYNAALREYDSTFEVWDELVEKLKDADFLQAHLNTGRTIARFEDKLVEDLLQYKERVLFEGYEIWAMNVSRTYRSILGSHLAEINEKDGGAPLGIVYYRNLGKVHVSLRSKGEVDVGEIAKKYGGGGHKHAASILVDSFADLPFTFI